MQKRNLRANYFLLKKSSSVSFIIMGQCTLDKPLYQRKHNLLRCHRKFYA